MADVEMTEQYYEDGNLGEYANEGNGQYDEDAAYEEQEAYEDAAGVNADGEPLEEEMQATVQAVAVDDDDPLTCKFCNVTVKTQQAMNRHKKFRSHLAKIRNEHKMKIKQELKEKGLITLTKVPTKPLPGRIVELVDWVMVLNRPLVGMEYIYEVHRFDTKRFGEKKLKYYICELCCLSEMPVFKHLLSLNHIVNYVVAHYDRLKRPIEGMQMDPVERKFIEGIIKVAMDASKTRFQRLKRQHLFDLLYRISNVIINAMGRKRCTAIKETQDSGKEVKRQPCLAAQVPGHTDDHYPEKLAKMLNTFGYNFSKYDTQEEMMEGRARLAAQRTWGPPGPPGPPPPHGPPGPPGPHGPMPPGPHGPPPRGPMEPWVGEPVAKRGLLEPPRPGGPPAPPNWAEEPAAAATARQGGSQPMGMGMALSRKNLTLLDWLHKTVEKFDNERLQPQDVGAAQKVASLLKCGIELYHSSQPTEGVCSNPAYVDPETVQLGDWLQATIRFFDTAWLCSEREVRIAKVVISQIESAVKEATSPSWSSQREVDPYDNLGNNNTYQEESRFGPSPAIAGPAPVAPANRFDMPSNTLAPGQRFAGGDMAPRGGFVRGGARGGPGARGGLAPRGGPAARGGPAPRGGPAARGGPMARGGPGGRGGPAGRGGPVGRGAGRGAPGGRGAGRGGPMAARGARGGRTPFTKPFTKRGARAAPY